MLRIVLSVLVFVVIVNGGGLPPNGEWESRGRVLSGGPTVAELEWINNWNGTKGAMLFSSVWNGWYFQDVPGTFAEPDSGIYLIENMADVLRSNNTVAANIKLVTGQLNWTTSFQGFAEGGLPGMALPFRGFIGSSGRFPVVPFRMFPSVPGRIVIVDLTEPQQPIIYNVTDDRDPCLEYFYQTTKLVDINGDGLTDILTIRIHDLTCETKNLRLVQYPLAAEFMAFLQPATLAQRLAPWPSVILYDFMKETGIINLGAGGYFDFVDAVGADGIPELLVANFLKPELAIYSLGAGDQNWLSANASRITRRVIDDSLGAMYDVQVVDLDRDGHVDIVSTTHTAEASNGIYAYVGPNFTERKTLASNFTVIGRADSTQRYRPGPFVIVPGRTPNRKPSIVVGTDGGGELVWITPNDDVKKGDWAYSKTVLAQCAHDILGPILYDADNDGRLDYISAPCLKFDTIFSFELVYSAPTNA